MNFKFRKPARLMALTLAASMVMSFSAMAADGDIVNADDSSASMINEVEIPVEVGDIVVGTAMGLGTVEALGVNVRENPNMSAAVVAVLDQGAQVVVLSKDGDWYRVSCEGVTGFVSCDYMSLVEGGQAELGYGLIKCEAANVRASADAESDAIASLSGDDVVTITGIYDGWYEVDINGSTGYILSDLVDPTAHIPAEKLYSYAVVACNGANLRAEASADAEKIDMLYDSTLCTLLAEEGDWYKVQYGDTVGYISSTLAAATNDATSGNAEIQTYNEVVAEQKAAEEAARKAAEEAAKQAAASQPTYTAPSYTYSEPSYDTSYDSGSSDTYYEDTYEDTYVEPSYDYSTGSSIVDVAYSYLGVPYVWGGTSPSGFDCSGFTQYVMRQCGYSIYRTADVQYNNGYYVSYDNLQPGDLVFFSNTYSEYGITHVGIYVGGGDFIHAANGGVKVTSLSSSYYASRYYGARRIA